MILKLVGLSFLTTFEVAFVHNFNNRKDDNEIVTTTLNTIQN